MRKMLIIVILSTILIYSGIMADEYEYSKEIIVMFKPKCIELSSGENEATVDQISTTPESLKSCLKTKGVEIISRAFKDFDESQRTVYSRTGELVKLPDLSDIYKLTLGNDKCVEEVATELELLSDVVYAEPNGGAKPCGWIIPNDQLFDGQWGLNDGGDTDIDAPEAWAITTGCNIKVGVIDYGVYASHQDLSGKVSGDNGWVDSHGTAVSGVIGANTNNSIGIAGVNWQAEIVSQRIDGGDDTDIYEAIMDAINEGAEVTNNSYRLLDEDGNARYSTTVHLAFANVYKMNCLSAAAMGNEGDNEIQYPAAFGQGVCAVGAINQFDTLCYFSSKGNHIDVVAPGDVIKSTIVGGYDILAGTSMATPFVSGIASLLLSIDQGLNNDDMENIIKVSAVETRTDPSPGCWDSYTGSGRVNAYNALRMLYPPYSLEHHSTGGNGVVHDLGERKTVFISVDGLVNGLYRTHIYKVTKDVSFNKLYAFTPYCWGRGLATTGFSLANPNFGLGYTHISNITDSGFRLETYVYKVYNVSGQFVGWIPCKTSGVDWGYTILGIEDVDPPQVTLLTPNGGQHYKSGDMMVIRWIVNDEYPEGTEATIQRKISDSLWEPLETGLSVDREGYGLYLYYVPRAGHAWTNQHERIKVITYDTNGHYDSDESDNDFTIEYLARKSGGGIDNMKPLPKEKPIPPYMAPLSSNYSDYLSVPLPNPFNPMTTFSFGIKNRGKVSLIIYDVKGEVVKTFYSNDYKSPGLYSEVWDGSNDKGIRVGSGVYFLRYNTGTFTETKKLILLR